MNELTNEQLQAIVDNPLSQKHKVYEAHRILKIRSDLTNRVDHE